MIHLKWWVLKYFDIFIDPLWLMNLSVHKGLSLTESYMEGSYLAAVVDVICVAFFLIIRWGIVCYFVLFCCFCCLKKYQIWQFGFKWLRFLPDETYIVTAFIQ